MDNIDEILRKSYKDIEIDNTININLESKIKRYRANNILKMVACFSVFLVIVSIGIISITNKDISNSQYISESTNNNNINNNTNTTNDNNLPIPSEEIKISAPANADLSKIYEAEHIVIAKIEKVVEYISFVPKINETLLPVTKLQATTIKNIKGTTDNTFEFIKSGGVISLAEYEKTLTEEQIKKQGLDKKTKEEKETTYVEIFTSLELNSPEIIPGKTYVICMRYDEIYEELSAIAVKMGIMEYDESTNSVKDNENNKWVDLELFLKNNNI